MGIVTRVVRVVHDARLVFFESTILSPRETHLCVASLDVPCGPITVLTSAARGTHTTQVSPDGKIIIDTYSSALTPPTIHIHTLPHSSEVDFEPVSGGTLLFSSVDSDPGYNRLASDLTLPEFFTFSVDAPNYAGQTQTPTSIELHGLLFKPDPETFGPGPYPLIVHVYGGPHVQYVLDSWGRASSNMQDQMLVSCGYAVARIDNRGSTRRGLSFEGQIKHAMGSLEVQDQAAGVDYLVQAGIADPNAVGIFGWSYGGYMSLMSLAKASSVFRVAVSGAPVTDWAEYTSAYTERYMGTPESNPDGYAAGSVLNHVDSISPDAKLLLIHGLIDENVLFRNTARVINALISAGKHHSLLLLPSERHAPRSQATREYIASSLLSFFDTHLQL